MIFVYLILNICAYIGAGEKSKNTPVHNEDLIPIYVDGVEAPILIPRAELLQACSAQQSESSTQPQAPPAPRVVASASRVQEDIVVTPVHAPPSTVVSPKKKPAPVAKKASQRRRSRYRSRSRRRRNSSESSDDDHYYHRKRRSRRDNPEDDDESENGCVGGAKAERQLRRGAEAISTNPSWCFTPLDDLAVERSNIIRTISVRILIYCYFSILLFRIWGRQ